MPPWHIDKNNIGIQKFKDDRSLTDEEIATIAVWADAGALRGNPAEMPPLEFPDIYTWQIGTPDLIVEIPEEYVVSPEGPDEWIDFFAATGLTETRYIKTLQGMPVVVATVWCTTSRRR